MNEECPSDCPRSGGTLLNLPLGVEESVWTYMDLTLLGSLKRIIQIETKFAQPPHVFKFYGCSPLTEACTNVTRSANEDLPYQEIVKGTPVTNQQNANTVTTYAYTVMGVACNNSILVTHPHSTSFSLSLSLPHHIFHSSAKKAFNFTFRSK